MSQGDEMAELAESSQNLKQSNSSQKLNQNQLENKCGIVNGGLMYIGAAAAVALSAFLGYYSYLKSSIMNDENRP